MNKYIENEGKRIITTEPYFVNKNDEKIYMTVCHSFLDQLIYQCQFNN